MVNRIGRYLCLLIVFHFCLHGEEAKPLPKPTVCLNMIVKNEKDVIARCLTSVLPLIDTWVIVDTGSTDGTQKIIKEFMEKNKVPGELYERPWVNFGHNRDEALQLAIKKADYILFIDADEYFVYEPGFKLPHLDKDFYYVNISHSGSKYGRNTLINTKFDWKWVGVLHEVVCSKTASTHETLQGVYNMYTTEGARSKDPQKYQKDAEILEAALKKEPNNERYVFYLAQSYRDARNYPQALKYYQKHTEMPAWDQERFWSLLRVAQLQELLDMPDKVVIESYKKAYRYRTSRMEPLYYLASFFRKKGDFESAYKTAKIAEKMPLSDDVLFVEKWLHDYELLLELSISAYWIGKYSECQQLSLKLLAKPDLPKHVRECVQQNLGFANMKLLEDVSDDVIHKKEQSA
jgi:glycosyltransferase involved in cell wall biosynthesis